MRRLAAIAAASLLLAGCAAPAGFDGYVHAECGTTSAQKVTECRVTEKPLPTQTVTAAPPPATTPPPAAGGPLGVPGNWVKAFEDNFDGTSVDAAKWRTNWYGEGGVMNKVGTYARNVSVAGGVLTLRLESTSAGALVHTDFTGGYKLPVGGVAEARVWFPGNGGTCYAWPAWWSNTVASEGWPKGGEHDIAETLSGKLTTNYHSPSGAHNGPAPAGTWCDGFHTYTLHRKAGAADVYWDGRLVRSYSTDDSGNPEMLILNIGSGGTVVAPAELKVDYVRAWQPA